jgi:hypothetical protein
MLYLTRSEAPMKKTTVYLPSETQAALRALARRKGQSQAALIREVIDGYLQQQARPLPRSLGLGSNPEVQAKDTEDWLAANFRPT